MSVLNLMVLPGRPSDPPTANGLSAADLDAPPLFYLLRHGSWHEVPPLRVIGLGDFRMAVEGLLTKVMQRVVTGQANANWFLQAQSREWWRTLVPEPLKQAVLETSSQARAAGVVPQLLINAHPTLEWIPWELLHDGDGYLGVNFQVARLPIVQNGGEPPSESRPVKRAVNLLGTDILTAVDQEAYTSWASTFDPFESLGVSGRRIPPDNLDDGWPTLDDLMNQRDADIIHITAHGGVDDSGRQYLALDQSDIDISSIDDSIAGLLAFEDPGPLVFGNACGSLPGQLNGSGPIVTRGLGVSFFDRGATAYIGAMAPLGTETAIRFAVSFYEFLLRDGLCVGEALRLAKRRLFDSGEQDPSYLFYCLYGLPGTRFTPSPTVVVTEQPSPTTTPSSQGD